MINGSSFDAQQIAVRRHLTPPSASGWTLWRTLECRTAGFPASMVFGLADTDCARCSDALIVARARAEGLWKEARAHLKSRIRKLLDQQRTLPEGSTELLVCKEQLRALRSAAKAVDRKHLGDALGQVFTSVQADTLFHAEQHRGALAAEFSTRYAEAAQSTLRHLQETAALPQFREAVAWQNKRLLSNVLDRLGDVVGGARRRNEELVASYLQRYCVKNDTIGFFGPVGWATWDDGVATVVVHSAPQCLASRHTYFEDWTVQALADRLSADRRLLPWIVPTTAPHARLEGETLLLPGDVRMALTPAEAAVFRTCNGQLIARQIADVLLQHPFLPFEDESQVFDVLLALARVRRIHMAFAVRLSDPWPERHLRAQLEAIDDLQLRSEAIAPLNQLEEARAAAARAAGCPDELAQALNHLDHVFESVTGIGAFRSAGATYGARTVVYEDCRRATDVRLGSELRARLQPSLDIVLTSARWFCHHVAGVFREALDEAYEHCGGSRVDLPTFWLRVQSLFYGDGPAGIESVIEELRHHWATLLQICDQSDQVRRNSEPLALAARTIFQAPDPGWAGACHQSPDVMIAATDTAAIDRGECLFVLGEVHVGVNTLMNHSAVQQHPDPRSLLLALRADLGTSRIVPLISRNGTNQPIRVQTVTDTQHDIELQFSLDALPLNSERSLRIADLWVDRGTGGLYARTRDGNSTFPLLDAFGQLLSGFVADKFRISCDEGDFSPRITIDSLVIQRRQWRVPCSALVFPGRRDDDASSYLAMREWAANTGLPRFSFVKLCWEKKPLYLDLDSPLYVRSLLRQVRKAAKRADDAASRVVFSEMLPAHDNIWMPLDDDNRCTSELRIVAAHCQDLPSAP